MQLLVRAQNVRYSFSEEASTFIIFLIQRTKEYNLTALRKAKCLPPVPSPEHSICWGERKRIATTCNESDGSFKNLGSQDIVKLPK